MPKFLDQIVKVWPILLALAAGFWQAFIWQSGVNEKLALVRYDVVNMRQAVERNTLAQKEHNHDQNLHMPFQEKIKMFVPYSVYREDQRRVLEGLHAQDERQRSIQQSVTEILAQLKK